MVIPNIITPRRDEYWTQNPTAAKEKISDTGSDLSKRWVL